MSRFHRQIMDDLVARNPAQYEFHQAVDEVVSSVLPILEMLPWYIKERVVEQMVEPVRTIMFRVPWIDDMGDVQVNRGYRIQMNNALGPFKGGLRFHPSVNEGILKFLAFEQVFKNALTMLPLGGAKGGSDFDPKGKSDREVKRFCKSFMTGLHTYIGPELDWPAGDIGCGGREIGFLSGSYRDITGRSPSPLTGKGLLWGGSLIRPEATGYGAVYFAESMLATRGESLSGKTCLLSGSGNVFQYAAEKLLELGAKPATASDSSGFIHDEDGIDREKLAFIMELKNVRRGRIDQYAERYPSTHYIPLDPNLGHNPLWDIEAHCAFPCATQNEVNGRDASNLLGNGVYVVSEGANMPSVPEAVEQFRDSGILYGPGKAANAGGVVVSGLEMTQNSMRLYWSREEVDRHLRRSMKTIHDNCLAAAKSFGRIGDYVFGANCAGFTRVADAMIDHSI